MLRVENCMNEATNIAPQTEKKQDHNLSLSGMSLLAGDGALFMSGRMNGKKGAGMVFTSLGWAAGGLVAMVFGKTPSSRVPRIEARKLESYLREQGIDVPRTVRDTHPLLRTKGPIDAALQFFYTYPSEVLNGVFAVFSLGMINDGLKSKDKRSLLWGGVAVVAGSLSGLFIKEDPQAREKAKNGNAIDKAVAFVKEKPLRVSGTLFMVNDYFLVKQAASEFKNNYRPSGGKDKRFLATSAAAAAYAIGNVFLWKSSRDSVKTSREQNGTSDQLQNLAVEIVAAQPKHLKDKALDSITSYFAKDREMELPVDTFREKLGQDVAVVNQRRITEVAERGWRTRHEAQKRAQENRATGAVK